jgi:serine/threonine protein kinase
MALRDACDPRRLDQFLHDRLPGESQRAVEAHLLTCPACRERLDELAGGPRWWAQVRQHLGGDGAAEPGRVLDPAATCGGRPAEQDYLEPSDRPGSLGRIGPYEVLEILGRGGFGIVFKAFDPALHRPVAIKVLAREFATRGAARKRFEREARAAAAVAHEHVVPVHAVDAEATPPYLVMAFVPGESLQQRLERTGPLQLREVLRIGMQAAAGLAAAHAQGLVHRDIKPANIMLENGIERVRLTDFGLARAVDDASVTQSGTVTGTPQYMAPEQAGGQAVDQRADLFAMGSTLYAMCAGRPPFRGDSGWAVLRQVCEAEPPSLRSLNPDVPAWLEGIIRKLHAKDPAERFASAAEVAELLGQCLAHVQQPDRQPLPARALELARLVPGPPPVRPHRRRQRSVLAALALLGLAGLGLWLAYRPAGEQRRQDASVRQRETRELEPELLRQMQHLQELPGQMHLQLDQMRQSLLGLAAMEAAASDLGVDEVRHRAAQLGQELSPGAESNPDPLDAQVRDIRQRLERLRQSAGDLP